MAKYIIEVIENNDGSVEINKTDTIIIAALSALINKSVIQYCETYNYIEHPHGLYEQNLGQYYKAKEASQDD